MSISRAQLPWGGGISRHAAAVLLLGVAACSPAGQTGEDAPATGAASSHAGEAALSGDGARAVAALGQRCDRPGTVRPRGQTPEGAPIFAVQCGDASYLVTLASEERAEIIDCELAAMQSRNCW